MSRSLALIVGMAAFQYGLFLVTGIGLPLFTSGLCFGLGIAWLVRVAERADG